MSVSLAEAAAALQSRSRRSRQRKLGSSEIGICRRRSGYRYHATPPSNSRSSIAAALGTWIHAGALKALREEYGALIEVKVESESLKSSVDAYFPETSTVEDLKTKSSHAFEMVRARGPARKELFQVHLYAYLLRNGRAKALSGPQSVDTVRVRYLNRDNGEEYTHEQPYDQQITLHALGWLGDVLDSDSPDELPRDEAGPGLSYDCDYCPFLDACWGPQRTDGAARQTILVHDDADVEAAALLYDQARAEEREAQNRKAFAKAQLDLTDDGQYGGFVVKHTSTEPKPQPDVERMEDYFREAGLEVPLTYRKPYRTISVLRAQQRTARE